MSVNAVTAAGITTKSQADLVTDETTSMQAIYGADINLNPDTPDGQRMMIRLQAILDCLDLIVAVYTSFDPDQAIGVTLDQRVAYNGIQRQTGGQFNTFSEVDIAVVTSQAVSLPGLDQNILPPYTATDDAGTQWQLISSQILGAAGAFSFPFQAVNPGAVLALPNTIKNQLTVIIGATSVNNPAPQTLIGTNEESDGALRIRRQKSVAIGSTGWFDAMLAALKNVSNIGAVKLYENLTGSAIISGPFAGMPASGIWVVVSGTALNADIANAIYTKRGGGVPMVGAVFQVIVQADGSNFTVRWDVAAQQALFVGLVVASLDGINPPNIKAMLAPSGLPALFKPGINEKVQFGAVVTAAQSVDPNSLISSVGFSLVSGGPFTDATETPTLAKNQFVPTFVITPIILTSPTSIAKVDISNNVVVTDKCAAGGATLQFTPQGGIPAYVYSILSGPGAVNAGTGLFTSAGAGTAVVQVDDANGNLATVTVTIT